MYLTEVFYNFYATHASLPIRDVRRLTLAIAAVVINDTRLDGQQAAALSRAAPALKASSLP
jgi:hypothetical protein